MLVSVACPAEAGLTPSSGRTTAGVLIATALASTLLAPPLLFPLAVAAVAATNDAGECSEPGVCVKEGEGGDGAVIPEYAAADAEAKGEVDADGGGGGAGADEFPTRHATNGNRLITKEELALHTTAQDQIWLSILGRVYNITDGEGFYSALKGGYKFYAGQDASPCFASGNNTPKGAEEKWEEWETKKQLGVYEWSTFYENHEKYQYLGMLAGSRYFNKDGNETELRRDIVEKCSVAKKIADEEREKKKTERMAAREARKQGYSNVKK